MRFFSLFSGIGGLEFGLRGKAKCVGISEIKESSVEIYKNHCENVKNYGDITKINISKLPEFDLLMGGFPCQSFSLAGLRKGFKDKMGKMIFYIYDIIQAKKPKFVVLENVKGIANHNNGKTIKDVIRLLSHLSYFVRVVSLNSMYYGSAQSRERVFFLCSRKDFKLKQPQVLDYSKRFRDVREKNAVYKFIKKTPKNVKKMHQKAEFNFELIGGYDRVGTLTTQEGCGEKLVYEKDRDDFRFLTPLECERLQGFPDGWTKGVSDPKRYFALGNAVHCRVSEYLFKDYLKDLWGLEV